MSRFRHSNLLLFILFLSSIVGLRARAQAVELRYFAGNYSVPGRGDVHFTIHAPLARGEYDTVLFLHGYYKSDLEWYMHQKTLAEHGLIAVAINYDETAAPVEMYKEVGTAISLLHDWPEARVVSIVGSSFGGRIGLEILGKFPELNVKFAYFVYPTSPQLTPEEFAAIEADILHVVGEVDPHLPASFWIANQLNKYNDQIQYKVHVYSAEDFPHAGRHGFFLPRREGLTEVGIDSFVRWGGFLRWALVGARPPDWRSDPRLLRERHLLRMGDF